MKNKALEALEKMTADVQAEHGPVFKNHLVEMHRIRTALIDMSWQPIETAPRDGTIVDLWTTDNGGCRVSDAKFEDGEWCTYRHLEEDFLGYGWWPVDGLLPTHWMHRPDAQNGGE